jgi:hypothetical protein
MSESWEIECGCVWTLGKQPTQNSSGVVLETKWATWHKWTLMIHGIANPKMFGFERCVGKQFKGEIFEKH